VAGCGSGGPAYRRAGRWRAVQAAEQETHGASISDVSAHAQGQPQEFSGCQPNYKSAAAEHADDAQRAEEVQPGAKDSGAKADRNQVEENADKVA